VFLKYFEGYTAKDVCFIFTLQRMFAAMQRMFPTLQRMFAALQRMFATLKRMFASGQHLLLDLSRMYHFDCISQLI